MSQYAARACAHDWRLGARAIALDA
jgi:hypothetical protein